MPSIPVLTMTVMRPPAPRAMSRARCRAGMAITRRAQNQRRRPDGRLVARVQPQLPLPTDRAETSDSEDGHDQTDTALLSGTPLTLASGAKRAAPGSRPPGAEQRARGCARRGGVAHRIVIEGPVPESGNHAHRGRSQGPLPTMRRAGASGQRSSFIDCSVSFLSIVPLITDSSDGTSLAVRRIATIDCAKGSFRRQIVE
jgi:hypothetical protein